MGWDNISTIRVDSYNPFYNKNSNCNKKRESIIHLYIAFYNYESDLTTTVFKTLLMGVYFCFQQNLSNYCNATKCQTKWRYNDYKMGRENIITIQVDNYNPFCNKNPIYNKTLSSQ